MRIAVVLFALVCASAHAQQRSVGDLISGHASTVIDGDTFRIGHDRIRIWGIDAPEWRARCMVGGRRLKVGRGSHAALTDCLRARR
jgi:endonuclease YncB( thermonuclease family)